MFYTLVNPWEPVVFYKYYLSALAICPPSHETSVSLQLPFDGTEDMDLVLREIKGDDDEFIADQATDRYVHAWYINIPVPFTLSV